MDYGPQKLADIRALGPANVVVVDLGQPGRVTHADAFQIALAVCKGLQPGGDQHDDQDQSGPLSRPQMSLDC